MSTLHARRLQNFINIVRKNDAQLQTDSNQCEVVTLPKHVWAQLCRMVESLPAVQPVMAGMEVANHDEAVRLLSLVFDAWENGDSCTEDGEPDGAYMGQCFQLDTETFDACCNLLNRLNPPRNAAPVAPVTEREGSKIWVNGEYGYQTLFDAIGSAVMTWPAEGQAISISVQAFENAMAAATGKVQK